MRASLVSLIVLVAGCSSAIAKPAPATTQAVGKFPFLQVDARQHVIQIECEALHCGNPLEFFLCSTGTNEHEAVLRSRVKPSHLHAALLMLGLTPGEPVHFSEAAQKWLPPHGPPLHLAVRFEREGKAVELPAYRLMRDVKSKREMPPMTWIFAGSRMLDNGEYGGDRTGYLVSVVNFDFSVIDIPRLASNANETLMWETNDPLMPPAGAKVTLIITPAGAVEAPATQKAQARASIDEPLIAIDAAGKMKLNDATIESTEQLHTRLQKRDESTQRVRVAVANAIEENETARNVINALSRAGIGFITIPQATAGVTTQPRVTQTDQTIAQMRQRWEDAVMPKREAVRDAAQTHFVIIRDLRERQQRLIDEADSIQRLIDELDKRYQDMTTPQPPQ
jgi:biopolymer transport protein ExbD